MSLMSRIKQFRDAKDIIVDWVGDSCRPLGQMEAQQRANICLTCPKNSDGNAIVSAIASAIKKQVEVKNAMGLRVDGEKRLRTCSVCGCCLRLKIWVPIKHLTAYMNRSELREFPDYCWMRKETTDSNEHTVGNTVHD